LCDAQFEIKLKLLPVFNGVIGVINIKVVNLDPRMLASLQVEENEEPYENVCVMKVCKSKLLVVDP